MNCSIKEMLQNDQIMRSVSTVYVELKMKDGGDVNGEREKERSIHLCFGIKSTVA